LPEHDRKLRLCKSRNYGNETKEWNLPPTKAFIKQGMDKKTAKAMRGLHLYVGWNGKEELSKRVKATGKGLGVQCRRSEHLDPPLSFK
jgi:hypothetical protein